MKKLLWKTGKAVVMVLIVLFLLISASFADYGTDRTEISVAGVEVGQKRMFDPNQSQKKL